MSLTTAIHEPLTIKNPLRRRLKQLYRKLYIKLLEVRKPIMVRRYRILIPGKYGFKKAYTFIQSRDNYREMTGESKDIAGQYFLFKRKHVLNRQVFRFIGTRELDPVKDSIVRSILRRLIRIK